MDNDPVDRELAELAIELALGAGELARHRRESGFDISAKSTPTDLVTAVDRDVEAWLTAQLGRRRPDDAILGEEGAGRPGSSNVRWVLDPIDGTVNFVLGLPSWAVSVAAEREGVVVAGCVYNPASRELFRAERGRGAFLGDVRLAGPRTVPLERSVVGTGFSYDADLRARQGAVVAALLPKVADIRRIGSAALDLCAVASGRLDAYYETGLQPWDRAAGLLIATEAGGAASGWRGAGPDDQLTAVCHPAIASEFIALLEELGAASVG
ncbi:MAG: inositol monophosphatase family protein [Actinomycetota bacterium]